MSERHIPGPPPSTIDESSAGSLGGPGDLTPRQERLAVVAFVVVAGLAVVWSFWTGRYSWFSVDDWDFFTRGSTFGDLLEPHHGHWTSIPFLAYRGLYAIVGLHHYWPYQALAIGCHVAVAALLRVVMRRSGVGPWVATAVAAVYLVFGAGRDDIVNGFMITLTGSLALGLVALLLTGHDGPIDRRDAWALAAGAAALMCSGLGLVMLGVVTVAAFARRGAKPALLQLVPLAALQLVWTVALGVSSANAAGRPTAGVWIRWVADAVSAVFSGLAHVSVVGIALAALLVVGLALAWGPMPPADLRRRAAAPAALLLGAVGFLVLTAYSRWNVAGSFRAERYVDIGAAFVLPALAVSIEGVSRRWRIGGPVAVGLLLVGVPWNVQSMVPTRAERVWYTTPKQILLAAPRSPFAPEVPADVRPLPKMWTDNAVTLGWLRSAESAGKLPAPPPLSVGAEGELAVRLGVVQSNRHPRGTCSARTGVTDLQSVRGEAVLLSRPITVSTVGDAGAATRPVLFQPADGRLLTFEADGIPLRLDPGTPDGSIEICR